MTRLLIGLLFLFWISVYEVYGGSTCTIDNDYSSSTYTKYCEYGCCGNYYDDNRDCCDAPSDSESHAGIYIGGGVGGVFSFLFSCCCIYYCCCRHSDNIIHVI
ncbi:uncharacterized protein LOC132721587 [Ruditapes philippinarum]|uniref:uncharacterized protein LOC132721587 n=1 Tax=Ruditapes philippinarum TaxID=129788 RepID=UPI00295BCF10|nr:uncharacterized protein LOC132721587 [Ruditapes philippinarum]